MRTAPALRLVVDHDPLTPAEEARLRAEAAAILARALAARDADQRQRVRASLRVVEGER